MKLSSCIFGSVHLLGRDGWFSVMWYRCILINVWTPTLRIVLFIQHSFIKCAQERLKRDAEKKIESKYSNRWIFVCLENSCVVIETNGIEWFTVWTSSKLLNNYNQVTSDRACWLTRTFRNSLEEKKNITQIYYTHQFGVVSVQKFSLKSVEPVCRSHMDPHIQFNFNRTFPSDGKCSCFEALSGICGFRRVCVC